MPGGCSVSGSDLSWGLTVSDVIIMCALSRAGYQGLSTYHSATLSLTRAPPHPLDKPGHVPTVSWRLQPGAFALAYEP